MNKKIGLISAVGGAISSIIGIIGTTCVVCSPVCGGICVVGPLVAILGVGIAGFLHKYNVVFIIIGGLLFLLGVFLIIRKRKINCVCPVPNDEAKHGEIKEGDNMDKKKVKKVVREAYGRIAQEQESCGCGPGICGTDAKQFAKSIGYTEEELKSIPQEANLALSCGNPTALASLKEGEVILDLGSGAGFDCFLAANKVGLNGKVIGVDMTPEMVEKARSNAEKSGVKNVEFRLGEIENLPMADNSVDVVISNCVINLSTTKMKVFQEVYRVLKPSGRIAISDIALKKELPQKIRQSIEAYVGCVGGAVLIDEYKKIVEASGLKDVKITVKGTSACIEPNTKDPIARAILDGLGEDESLDGYVVSVYVDGHK